MAKTLTMDDRICEQYEKTKTNYVFDEILIFLSFNLMQYVQHQKLHTSQFGNNNCAIFSFHKSIRNRHICHSSTCIA
jgi:hypothetical protein